MRGFLTHGFSGSTWASANRGQVLCALYVALNLQILDRAFFQDALCHAFHSYSSHLWGSDTWLFRLYRGCPPAEAPEALRSQNFKLQPTAPLALALGCTSTDAMELPSAENAR